MTENSFYFHLYVRLRIRQSITDSNQPTRYQLQEVGFYVHLIATIISCPRNFYFLCAFGVVLVPAFSA